MFLFAIFTSLFVMSAPPSEEVAIRHLLSDRMAAWENQDVAELVDEFAEDADYIDSSGNLTTGRKAIEENYKKIFASGKYKGTRSTQEIKKVRLIHADVAIVDAEWTLSGLVDTEGKPLPNREGTSVIVLVKEGKEWKIVTLRASLSMPKPAEKK